MVRLRTSGMLWFFATEPGHRTEARRRWHRIAQSWPRRSGRSCPAVFSHLAVSGQADWTPQRLAWVSTLMAWDEGQTLTVRFEHACQARRRAASALEARHVLRGLHRRGAALVHDAD